MYSSANTEEIESRLVCTYNEKCRSAEAYDSLIMLVRIWRRISIRVKVIIQGQHLLWNFRSNLTISFAIVFDLNDYSMKNFVLCTWYLLSVVNLT